MWVLQNNDKDAWFLKGSTTFGLNTGYFIGSYSEKYMLVKKWMLSDKLWSNYQTEIIFLSTWFDVADDICSGEAVKEMMDVELTLFIHFNKIFC